ncbi:acyltransferase family protein [Fictibacillus sp. Mic-4]|uniref:acyltransferase family protein n=1 Tax=Fictibacillus TaxID=1329200 RepID=UPI00040C4C45|nr:acyltransferase family protein [Fictibacillus gelatini]
MPKPTKGNGRYMAGLDGLRAIAVLAVIAYHLNFSWAPGGFLGVTVFFVLSGYLITDLLVAEWSRTGRLDMKDFWIRRARRLLPALLVMLVLVVAWVTLFHPTLLPKLRGDVVASIFYVSNWWSIFHHVSYFESFGLPSPINNLWSLAVEEQFYLIWPLILLFGLRYIRRKGKIIGLTVTLMAASALAMAILYEPGADPSRVYYGTDTRAFSLLIGASLALVWPSRSLSAKLPSAHRLTLDLAGATALICVILIMWKTNQYDTLLYRGGMVHMSVAAAVLVAALAHPASRLGKWLGSKPLRWIGVRSYAIYLWHYPVITLTTPAVNTEGINSVRVLLQIAATFILAALSWTFIENPIRHGALKRWWTKIRLRQWQWNRIPKSRRVAIGCLVLILGISCVGLIGLVPGSHSAASKLEQPLDGNNEKTERNKKGHHVDQPKTKKGKHSEQSKDKHSKKAPSIDGSDVTVIGDSVMVDVEPYLKKRIPGVEVNAEIGRQMSDADDIVRDLKSNGDLGNYIVLELGTNGPFTKDQLMELLQSVGENKKIVLVNTRVPRPWENVVNSVLEDVASSHPRTALVDWYGASAGHDSYFAPDGVHLNPEGAKAYASLVKKAVEKL